MNPNTQAHIALQIEESLAVKQALLNEKKIIEQIQNLGEVCIESLRSGGKIIFAGNGGSFSDAQHLSAELVSRLMFDRPPLASVVLGANNSAFSAIGNDYGYEQVFARELAGIAKVNDVFIPISTSGNSANILSAVSAAKDLGVLTFGMTGQSGGKIASLCECIRIPSNRTARIQECHILLGHILCELVEACYFQKITW